MKKNYIVVTGGVGFIGSNLIRYFLNKTKLKYNRAVDNSFNDISGLIKKFERVDKLEELTFLFDEIIIDINKENSQIE